MSQQKMEQLKAAAAHIIAVLLVLLMCTVAIMSISGAVDLTNPAVSLFVGSLVGLIAGLLASPLVWYYGAPPSMPDDPPPPHKGWDGVDRRKS